MNTNAARLVLSRFSSARALPRAAALWVVAVLLLSAIAPIPAFAQGVSGFSDYFVLGSEDHVWRMMERVRATEGGAFPLPARVNSILSATATSSNQVLYYDHWEDGLDPNLSETGPTGPLQATTLVLGDGNNANGRACDWTKDPRVVCGGADEDKLFAGTALSLASDQGLAGSLCAAPYLAPPDQSQIRCSVPIRPAVTSINRAGTLATVTTATAHGWLTGHMVTVTGATDPLYNGTFSITVTGGTTFTYTMAGTPAANATGSLVVTSPSIRFGGGDRVFNTGGSLSIAHVMDPGTPLMGGATELLSRELVQNAVAYSVPIGEDLAVGANAAFASAKYGALDIVAFDDNTSITVNSPGPGGGIRSLTLHRGQHYSTCAASTTGTAGQNNLAGTCTAGSVSGPPPPSGPDNRGIFPAQALRLTAGTKISTNKPLNALIFTGANGTWQTRHYATLPDILHTTDYVTTAPGPAVNTTRVKNLFIYNPNPNLSDPDLMVTVTYIGGSTVVAIPSNQVRDFRNAVGTFVPANSTVRLTAPRPFWGLTAYDSTNLISDWGHAWLGVRFLTTDYTAAYSPGTQVYPITSITCDNATTARATTAIPNEFDNNDLVRVAGATGAPMNGTFIHTDISTTVFTYPVTACTAQNPAPAGTKVVGICDATDTNLAGGCDSYNRDPLWVSGTQNNTQVRIDLDADGIFDFVDINSDGCPDSGDGPIQAPGVCASNTPAFSTTPSGGTCSTVPTANSCVYLVNAPGTTPGRNSLRVWDYKDMDNGGTRVLASRPVVVSWGQDVDQGESGDPSPDNGYTVYPEISIDLVIGIEKSVNPLRVPLSGGVATYTVKITAGDYGPLTFLSPKDTLPVGIVCADFVPGSSLITFPDLSTDANPPVCTDNAFGPGTRSQLVWTPAQTTLQTLQTTTITYQVNIPANGSPRTLENEAEVTANLGGSVYNPKDRAVVSQSDLTIVKGVTDDGNPEIGDILTYTVAVTNGGTPETNVNISDAIPPFTTFVPGSINAATPATGFSRTGGVATATMPVPHNYVVGGTVTVAGAPPFNGSRVITAIPSPTTFEFALGGTGSVAGGTVTPSSAPLTGAFSGGSNAVEWTGTPFAANAVVMLTFQVQINAATPSGSIIPNFANYSSSQTPSIDSNTVETVVVGPVLSVVKSGPPGPLHPNEVATFTVTVTNSGSGAAANLVLSDNLAGSNMTYSSGTMSMSLNGGPFTPLTDAADADPGTFAGTTLTLTKASLGAGQNVVFRFNARVNPGTGGLFAVNQAQLTTTGQPPIDSNLVQIPIVGNADLTGRVFLDYDGDGVQDPGEPGAVGVAVSVTDSTAVTQIVYTDANGDYIATVPAGSTTINPDQTSGDIPPGSVLTTAPGCVNPPGTAPPCNDPQTVTAVANATTPVPFVGYDPPGLSLTKTSDGGGTVVPGDTVTYTMVVTNNSATTQTGIRVTDSVPADTTYVPSSAKVTYPTGNAFRVTEYYIDNAGPDQCTEAGTDFPNGNTTCTLTLNQALASNYFVIVQGSSVNGGDSQPASDYVGLTGAPAGTPGVGADLTASGAANRIVLSRGNGTNDWIGVITVVECISPSCATDPSGFQLLDVKRVDFPAATGTPTGTVNAATSWTDLSRTMLIGGANGAGCTSSSTDPNEHHVCHPRLFPSGANTINWQRDQGGSGTLDAATATVMAIQWGSAWTVQRAAILGGNNGGDSINVTNEYNTVAINPVARDHTWVWGTGTTSTADNNTGDSPEGVALTLGDGVNQNATESLIAAGLDETNNNLNMDVYALTHPLLAVDYRFLVEGNSGNASVNQAVDSATSDRMALVYNDFDEHNNDFPKPILSARYTSNTNVQLQRQRTGGGNWAAWVQGIDFSGVRGSATITCTGGVGPDQCTPPAGAPTNIVDPASNFTLLPGESMTVTFQVTVNANASPGTVTNTAQAQSNEEPQTEDSASDDIVIPGVTVEPNNAGFAIAGTTITFTHEVVNRGSTMDSFDIVLNNQSGWKVELIDPTSGGVIATDTNGDGVWDVGTVNTGALAPNAKTTYRVRVTVPPGTPDFFESTTELSATSTTSGLYSAVGTSEITVLPGTSFGTVEVVPDQSGVVTAGSFTAYPQRVFNNTGASAIFDLALGGTQGWANTVHADTNGDGLYTPGVDIAITNTASIPNGSSQLLFVVVDPGAASPGTVDVSILTAVSQTDPLDYDSATITTIVTAPTALDLSGGGSRVVVPGDLARYPGVLYNLAASTDRFNFTLSPASLFGIDGLSHPTQLWFDTNADGTPDTLVATDTDGNGTWDTIVSPGLWDVDSNGQPDFQLGANSSFDYELRRPIDAAQELPTEFVTLTATGTNSPQADAVTAQWIIAAVTRASIRGLRVDPSAGIVEFATGTQSGTRAFRLYETATRRGSTWEPLHDRPVRSPLPDSASPILYRVETQPLKHRFIVIQEIETSGKKLVKGPFAVGDQRLLKGLEKIEARLDATGVAPGAIRVARMSPRARDAKRRFDRQSGVSKRAETKRPSGRVDGVRIEIDEPGLVEVSMADIEAQGLRARGLKLWNKGRAVPFDRLPRKAGIRFVAEPLSTDYTGDNVYVLTEGSEPFRMAARLTDSGDRSRPGYQRAEREVIYLSSTPEGADPWLWDLLLSNGEPWPYADWDPTGEYGLFDLPGWVAPGAQVPVKIRIVGYTAHTHTVSASINGATVGSVTFDGPGEALISGRVNARDLRQAGNRLSMVATAVDGNGQTTFDGYVYLDYVDVAAAPVAPAPGSVAGLSPYSGDLPTARGVEYLIVTHPLFREAADRIAALKTDEGFETTVVETDALYDRFSGGIVEANAIRTGVRYFARKSGRLKYLLLIGDDTFDARDVTGFGARVFVPSLYARDNNFGRIPSENLYADLNDDGRPDIAVGRLAAQTLEEASILADKVEGQAAALAAYSDHQIFAADDQAAADDAPFRDEAGAMAALSGGALGSLTFPDIADGVGTARSQLLDAWKAGASQVHYFGHGGPELWADESLFTTDDVSPDLKSALVFMWACESQLYQYLWGPSVGEALMLTPGGGAVASFGPVGIAAPGTQRILYEGVYRQLLTGGKTLGEIIRRAKSDALKANPSSAEVVYGFNLLGDPALRIPER